MKSYKSLFFVGPVILILIGAIVGCNVTSMVANVGQNTESVMITLLSIIVTLGVAYSFFSIYKADSEIRNLYQKMNRLQNDFNLQAQKVASDLKRTNHIWLNLTKIDSEAAGKFNDKKYLLAIKNELESILFMLNNSEYLEEELTSSIGRKRANISNDILLLIDTITEFKLNKIGEKGYRDAHNSIIRLMECIRIHSEWSKISENEKIRYSFMFKTLDKILTQLTKREFPLPVTKDVEVRKRLSFYYKKYIEGNKSDEDNGYSK